MGGSNRDDYITIQSGIHPVYRSRVRILEIVTAWKSFALQIFANASGNFCPSGGYQSQDAPSIQEFSVAIGINVEMIAGDHGENLQPKCGSVLSLIFSKARIQLWTKVFCVLLISLLFLGFVLPGNSFYMVKVGDFPAFYAAGVLSFGDLARLYDPLIQASVQGKYFALEKGEFLYFAYPPYVSLFFAPLVLFPPILSKALYTVILLGALWSSARSLFPLTNGLSTWDVFGLFLLCVPLYGSVAAGQNTAIAVCILSGTLAILQKSEGSESRRAFLSGVVLGLLFYKPHFAVVLVFLLAYLGRREVLYGSLIPLGAYYLIASLSSGFAWPLEWARSIVFFAEEDFLRNSFQMVSISGAARALAQTFEVKNHGGVDFVSGLLSISLMWFMGRRVLQRKRERAVPDSQLAEILLLSIPTTLRVSPHTLFYDMGLLVVPFVACVRLKSDYQGCLVVALILLLGVFSLSRDYFAVSPLLFFTLGFYMWMLGRGQKTSY